MNTPIPRDIPLPLPAPELLLKILLVIAFLAHIVFVNLMVGGTLLTLVYELKGLKRKLHDEVALTIAKTITVNKSIAVVLGVAPLLLINVLYTVWFYSANALTGTAWIMIPALVVAAFLLTYLHQYSWQQLAEHKAIHLSIIAAAVSLFLTIPFIFLVNINLMLFPDRWREVKGFLSAVLLPNVLPRYLHFITASLAVTGLFMVGWLRRSQRKQRAFNADHGSLEREFYTIALVSSGAQFMIGPIVLLTLPSQGMSLALMLVIGAGALMALPAIYLMWQEIKTPLPGSNRRFALVVALLTATVICMGTGRHFYRDTALKPYQEAQKDSAALAAKPAEASVNRGEEVFQICSACHGIDHKIVGPPLTEIARIYDGNPEGIVKWAKNPGKKRAGFPQMPPMALPDEDLLEVGKYMIKTGKRAS